MTALMAATVDALTHLQPKELGECEGALVVELVECVLRLGTLERSGGVDLAGHVAQILEVEEGFSNVILGD